MSSLPRSLASCTLWKLRFVSWRFSAPRQSSLGKPLPSRPPQRMYDSLRFAILEICLALTIFREELSPRVIALFVGLLVFKAFHVLVDARMENVRAAPRGRCGWPPLSLGSKNQVNLHLCLQIERHAQQVQLEEQPESQDSRHSTVGHGFFLALASSMVMIDCITLGVFMYTISGTGPTVLVLFAFETCALLLTLLLTLYRYSLFCIGTRVEAATGSDWHNKNLYLMYGKLFINTTKLATLMVYFVTLLTFYGMPFLMIRDLWRAFDAVNREAKNLIATWRMRREVAQRFFRPTQAEVDDVGALDPIYHTPLSPETSLKLPCGHILNEAGLMSWWERQQNCPVCRYNIMQADPPEYIRERRARQRAAGEGDAESTAQRLARLERQRARAQRRAAATAAAGEDTGDLPPAGAAAAPTPAPAAATPTRQAGQEEAPAPSTEHVASLASASRAADAVPSQPPAQDQLPSQATVAVSDDLPGDGPTLRRSRSAPSERKRKKKSKKHKQKHKRKHRGSSSSSDDIDSMHGVFWNAAPAGYGMWAGSPMQASPFTGPHVGMQYGMQAYYPTPYGHPHHVHMGQGEPSPQPPAGVINQPSWTGPSPVGVGSPVALPASMASAALPAPPPPPHLAHAASAFSAGTPGTSLGDEARKRKLETYSQLMQVYRELLAEEGVSAPPVSQPLSTGAKEQQELPGSQAPAAPQPQQGFDRPLPLADPNPPRPQPTTASPATSIPQPHGAGGQQVPPPTTEERRASPIQEGDIAPLLQGLARARAERQAKRLGAERTSPTPTESDD